jgi:Ser/Thr protein kinase RdoA (MazF antagonist)
VLDLGYLLDESITRFLPHLDAVQGRFIDQLRSDITSHLPRIPAQSPYFGICHGDPNAGNFHVNEDGALTLFDFDQCGYGWRAFDIGKFFSCILGHARRADIEQAFLDGYQSRRELSGEELAAIPWFVKLAQIWVMGINADNADYIGHKWMREEYWRRRLERLAGAEPG